MKLGLGGGIGFLSGISGIGGGIFLSPILHLSRFQTAKVIASLTSVFILVNSIVGIAGLKIAGNLYVDTSMIYKLIIGVALGSFLGSYISNKELPSQYIVLLTAILVVYVGTKIILKNAFDIKLPIN